MKETVTPHKISILLLIRVFGEMKLKVNKDKQSRLPVLAVVNSAEAQLAEEMICNPRFRRNYCMLMLKLIQGPDMPLNDLYTLLISKEDSLYPELFESFHKYILSIVRLGIEGILELVNRVNLLMVEPTHVMPVITKTSVLGLYIRRTVVMFEKLSCSGVVEVFKLFKAYQSTAPKLDKKNPLRRNVFSNVVTEEEEEEEEPMIQGTPQKLHQVDVVNKDNSGALWTRRQAELFLAQQSSLILKNEGSAMAPVELHTRIQQLLKANPDCSEAYFLSYLNFLRVRDFCGAMHSLYHCFDRGAGFHVDPKQGTPVTGTTEDKARSFRYGALNLAMFFSNFGHKKEAMLALKECVMLAHGSSCNFCLQHALCWLYRLCDENKVVLMERSIARSNELSLHYLSSLGIQSLAQHSAFSSTKPAIVFEMVSKSDFLNCQNSLLDLAANSYSLKSSLWMLYGRPAMANLFSQLLLHSESQNYSGEAACLALCHLATHLISQGEHQLCASVLWHVQERFTQLSTHKLWICCEQVIGFGLCMRQGLWQEARRKAEQLAAADQWESKLRLSELQLQQGDSVGALEKLSAVLEHCSTSQEISPSLQVRAITLAARVQGNTPAAVARLLVSALSQAHARHLTDLATLITLQLAEHQLRMGLASQALHLVGKILLLVLAHGSLQEQAETMLLQAKCTVATADRSKPEWNTTLSDAIELLDRAKAKFEKIRAVSKVKEVLLLQIVLYHQRDMQVDKFRLALELRIQEEQIASKMSSHV